MSRFWSALLLPRAFFKSQAVLSNGRIAFFPPIILYMVLMKWQAQVKSQCNCGSLLAQVALVLTMQLTSSGYWPGRWHHCGTCPKQCAAEPFIPYTFIPTYTFYRPAWGYGQKLKTHKWWKMQWWWLPVVESNQAHLL